jgi:hypothetical protein
VTPTMLREPSPQTAKLFSDACLAAEAAKQATLKTESDRRSGGSAVTFDEALAHQAITARDAAWLAAVKSFAVDLGVPLPQTVS